MQSSEVTAAGMNAERSDQGTTQSTRHSTKSSKAGSSISAGNFVEYPGTYYYADLNEDFSSSFSSPGQSGPQPVASHRQIGLNVASPPHWGASAHSRSVGQVAVKVEGSEDIFSLGGDSASVRIRGAGHRSRPVRSRRMEDGGDMLFFLGRPTRNPSRSPPDVPTSPSPSPSTYTFPLVSASPRKPASGVVPRCPPPNRMAACFGDLNFFSLEARYQEGRRLAAAPDEHNSAGIDESSTGRSDQARSMEDQDEEERSIAGSLGLASDVDRMTAGAVARAKFESRVGGDEVTEYSERSISIDDGYGGMFAMDSDPPSDVLAHPSLVEDLATWSSRPTQKYAEHGMELNEHETFEREFTSAPSVKANDSEVKGESSRESNFVPANQPDHWAAVSTKMPTRFQSQLTFGLESIMDDKTERSIASPKEPRRKPKVVRFDEAKNQTWTVETEAQEVKQRLQITSGGEVVEDSNMEFDCSDMECSDSGEIIYDSLSSESESWGEESDAVMSEDENELERRKHEEEIDKLKNGRAIENDSENGDDYNTSKGTEESESSDEVPEESVDETVEPAPKRIKITVVESPSTRYVDCVTLQEVPLEIAGNGPLLPTRIISYHGPADDLDQLSGENIVRMSRAELESYEQPKGVAARRSKLNIAIMNQIWGLGPGGPTTARSEPSFVSEWLISVQNSPSYHLLSSNMTDGFVEHAKRALPPMSSIGSLEHSAGSQYGRTAGRHHTGQVIGPLARASRGESTDFIPGFSQANKTSSVFSPVDSLLQESRSLVGITANGMHFPDNSLTLPRIKMSSAEEGEISAHRSEKRLPGFKTLSLIAASYQQSFDSSALQTSATAGHPLEALSCRKRKRPLPRPDGAVSQAGKRQPSMDRLVGIVRAGPWSVDRSGMKEVPFSL